MILQELFETTEEDRALISLSSAIYAKLQPYQGGNLDYENIFDQPDQQLIKIGKIGDIFNTPLEALNNISIEVQGGEPFIERAKDPDEVVADYEGKQLYGFYEEDTRTVVLNLELLDKQRMKTSITHELRHALDEIKSGSFPGDAKGYFTPRKKEHRKDDPYSTTQYRAQPAEINARFVEVLDILSKRIPQWVNKLQTAEVRPKILNDLNHLFVKYEIADLFPEKSQSKDYKRLMKRAADFIDKEIQHTSNNNHN